MAKRAGNTPEMEIIPRLIPTDVEDVFTGDVHLVEIHLVTADGVDTLVTIMDKQAVPMPVFPFIRLAGTGEFHREFTGRLCPGGVTWVADHPNSVTGYMRGWQ